MTDLAPLWAVSLSLATTIPIIWPTAVTIPSANKFSSKPTPVLLLPGTSLAVINPWIPYTKQDST